MRFKGGVHSVYSLAVGVSILVLQVGQMGWVMCRVRNRVEMVMNMI